MASNKKMAKRIISAHFCPQKGLMSQIYLCHRGHGGGGAQSAPIAAIARDRRHRAGSEKQKHHH
jgi:hypothetical protein